MTGVCGTSKNKKVYQYYQCNKNRRRKCHLKSMKKYYLEDLVVTTVINILIIIISDKIDKISKNICDFSEKESNTDTLKRFKKLIKENEKATENLLKALEAGKAINIISAQVEKRQLEKQNLEAELAKEKILNPKLEFAQVKFFFDRFKNGNMNDMKFCQYMVDTFINRVFLFKEKLLILCNACDSNKYPSGFFSS